MIKSMTGFASVSHENELVSFSVTVRSLNHRYLDLHIRVPPTFVELEQDIRSLVQQRVARGRVELAVVARLKTEAPVELDVNETLVAALVKTGIEATKRGWVETGLTAGELLRFPGVATVREITTDPEAWKAICVCISEATAEVLTELDRMRCREGEFLFSDLTGRAAAVKELVDRLVDTAQAGDEALRDRLKRLIGDLGIGGVQTDPVVLAQEVVKWVARSDIHEEVARLYGHLEHLAGLAEAAAPCGRKLDFLLQEMNREINTIGSKAEGREVGSLVVAAKAELEKLREQIQNME